MDQVDIGYLIMLTPCQVIQIPVQIYYAIDIQDQHMKNDPFTVWLILIIENYSMI